MAMSTLERAIEIAAHAHAGQLDKAGQPYILHPLRLLLAVHTLQEQIVAVLHDVVEDTAVTLVDLQREGFANDVLDAVQALTKQPGESRGAAARRAVANPIARIVKLADVTDHMDLARIAAPTDADYARVKEYEAVRAILVSGYDTPVS